MSNRDTTEQLAAVNHREFGAGIRGISGQTQQLVCVIHANALQQIPRRLLRPPQWISLLKTALDYSNTRQNWGLNIFVRMAGLIGLLRMYLLP